MDAFGFDTSSASYPSALVDTDLDANIDPNLFDAPLPNPPAVVPDLANTTRRRVESHTESDSPSQSKPKRQRTQTDEELQDEAQSRYVAAINIEARTIQGEVEVFTQHLMQPNYGTKGGAGQPRNPKSPISPPVSILPQFISPASPTIVADGRQGRNKQAVTGNPFSSGFSDPKTHQCSGPQKQGAKSASAIPPFLFSRAEKYLSGGSQFTPPSTAASCIPSKIAQKAAEIAAAALHGTSQQQTLPTSSTPTPTTGGVSQYLQPARAPPAHRDPRLPVQPASAAPVLSNNRGIQQAARADINTRSSLPPAHRDPRLPVQPASAAPVLSNNRGTQQAARADINTRSSLQGAVQATQPSSFAPLPVVNKKQRAQSKAAPKSTANPPLTQGAAQPAFGAQVPHTSASNQSLHAHMGSLNTAAPNGSVFEGFTDEMDHRNITENATKAWAAHGIAPPSAFFSHYPPAQDSRDLQRAAGKTANSYLPGRVIYLSISFSDLAETDSPKTLYLPVDWDLAFYHSGTLAWYYSGITGHSPTIAFPIKLCFQATGYIIVDWMYKQTIYPLPLVQQTPLFPQQDIPDEQTLLVDIWICALHLQIPKLQNLALNELDRVRNVSGQMNIQALIHVYEHTEKGSPLRQYFVWQYANRLSEQAIMEGQAAEYYPKQFMLDWIMMLTQMWKSKMCVNEALGMLGLDAFLVREKNLDWEEEELTGNGGG